MLKVSDWDVHLMLVVELDWRGWSCFIWDWGILGGVVCFHEILRGWNLERRAVKGEDGVRREEKGDDVELESEVRDSSQFKLECHFDRTRV